MSQVVEAEFKLAKSTVGNRVAEAIAEFQRDNKPITMSHVAGLYEALAGAAAMALATGHGIRFGEKVNPEVFIETCVDAALQGMNHVISEVKKRS